MRSVEIRMTGVGIWVRGVVCRVRCWFALGWLEVKPRLGLRICVLLLMVILPGSNKRRVIPPLLTRGVTVGEMSVVVVVVIVPRFL
jgi:hypothetical protein